MNTLEFILARSSVPAKYLCEPAPSEKQLNNILQCAMSAPDHNHLTPFRFLIIQKENRELLGAVFEKAVKARQPDAGEAYFKKQHDKPQRSPLIIAVIFSPKIDPKVPKIEQQLTTACAAQNILYGANSLGFGACWLTGDNAYDPQVKEALGLTFDEEISGFIYIGSIAEHNQSMDRKSAQLITQQWDAIQTIDTAI